MARRAERAGGGISATIDRLNTALAGRYTIERELGAGGMATVYLAHDVKHDRQVAIKVLKPELAAVLGAERFVVEIKTTAALQHPHILPLFDSGAGDGFLYYVMPFIDGETLRAKLDRETQFGVDEAVRIASNVADALDYAHRHGVIHRDIKPENILLHDGRPMVADFGIALAVSAAAGGRMTETGLSLGTPHYMSPEQATAEKEITARSDIYSIGSVLYEMLTGNPPHTGASAQQIIMKIITETPPPVTTLRKSVPLNVAAAVAKSLEKLPADRFDSAKAFADALVNPTFTTMHGTGAGSGSVFAHGGVSKRLFVATAAVAVLAVVAAAAGWLRTTPSAEVSRFSIVLPDSQQLAANPGSFRLAVSRDGRQVAYVGPGASAGSTRLWVRRLDQLRATTLAGTDGAINPAFSPDGQFLAFVAGTPRALRKIALAGGVPVTLTDSLVDVGGVSWGSDGHVYYDGHLTGDGLARVRETGGKPEVASMPDTGESWHSGPDALPNGRGVLMNIARGRGIGGFDVGVIDTKTGKHTVLVRGGGSPRYAESGHLLYVTPDGTLMAAPFDTDRLVLTGESVPITSGITLRSLARADIGVSANGLLVYAAGATRPGRELVWVSRDGTATLVDSQWTPALSGRAALSPDGKTAAVGVSVGTGPTQLWVKQLDRGPASKLADVGAFPSWSPDGKSILFVADLGLSRIPADGSVLPTTVYSGESSLRKGRPEYSPDGTWIIFNRGGGDIVGRRADGDSTVQELVASPAVETHGTISPDGRWLAYSSEESGRAEVYVRPFPDTKVAKRQVSVAGGTVPRWSHDGHELFFVDDRYDIIAVPVTLSPTFATGTPHRLFACELYQPIGFPFDVSRDGRRFLMSRMAGGGSSRPDELVLVQNFFEELKAKVKAKR